LNHQAISAHNQQCCCNINLSKKGPQEESFKLFKGSSISHTKKSLTKFFHEQFSSSSYNDVCDEEQESKKKSNNIIEKIGAKK